MRETVKYCGGCRTRKPIEAFANHRRMPDGKQGRCRVCAKAYAERHRALQRERESSAA